MLEEELGVILFNRTSRNLELTDAGILLQNKSSQLLELYKSTVNEMKNFNNGIEGTLGIGTVCSSGINILPQKIKEFCKQHPKINYEIYEGNSFKIMELLNNGVIDVGFVREPFNLSLYNSFVIKDNLKNNLNDYFVVMAKSKFYNSIESNTILINELKDKPLIINRRYDDVIKIACNKAGFEPHIICKNDDIITSLSWAEAGIGISILPLTASNILPNVNLKIKKIIEPSIESYLRLIWTKNKSLSNISRNFIKMFDKNIFN